MIRPSLLNALAFSLIILSFYMMACSEVKFKDQASDGNSAAQGGANTDKYDTNGDDTTGQLNQPPGANPPGTNPPGVPNPNASNPPGTNPPGTSPGNLVPKVVFVGPPCVRGSACVAEFHLDKAYGLAVDFDWRTDDTLYLQTPPAGSPAYGQPAVHYVSTSGHITFAAGETMKRVTIQNINPYNIAIIIGVRMSRCTFGGAAGLCSDFFRP